MIRTFYFIEERLDGIGIFILCFRQKTHNGLMRKLATMFSLFVSKCFKIWKIFTDFYVMAVRPPYILVRYERLSLYDSGFQEAVFYMFKYVEVVPRCTIVAVERI